MAKEVESIFRGFNIDGTWYPPEEKMPEIVIKKTTKALNKMFEFKEFFIENQAD